MTKPADPTVWRTISARQRNCMIDEIGASDAANQVLYYKRLYTEDLQRQDQNMRNDAMEAPYINKKNDLLSVCFMRPKLQWAGQFV